MEIFPTFLNKYSEFEYTTIMIEMHCCIKLSVL